MCSWGLVLTRGASVGHRIWGGNRCECGFGLCANRVRFTFWSKKPASALLAFRLFPLAGAGMRRLGLGARRACPPLLF